MDEAPSAPEEVESEPRRRPSRKAKKQLMKCVPVQPGEFFFRLMDGIAHSEGIAGIGGASTVGILANPSNPPRWYAAYLVMCRNWDRFIDGDVRVQTHNLPPAVLDVMKELSPACFEE